ncbi:ATP-dependent zinc metalloprotease FtsH [Chlamydiia bacterium]|nr:ATP-dependent zinc metalloprotease FtsH [Chlamydiia bacterium]
MKGILETISKEYDGLSLYQLTDTKNYQLCLEKIDGLNKQLTQAETYLNDALSDPEISGAEWFYKSESKTSNEIRQLQSDKYQIWFLSSKKVYDDFDKNSGGVFTLRSVKDSLILNNFKVLKDPIEWSAFLTPLISLVLFGAVIFFLFIRPMKGAGNNAMSFSKSPAKLLSNAQNKVTFDDVAGIEEAKEELEEIVDFLRQPKKYVKMGADIPKGVLMVGQPGTGKTLIARAVAGEANRPFFTISGSDFVEMFVGVGASRIRDLFLQAKKNAPCIIFIDEIDAVGRQRGVGVGGGHDEREQTLNQLLVEMDGFESNEGVILMAATNRPDVLDKALLRPGRFDRTVTIDLPDAKGRHEILKIHVKKIKIDPKVDLSKTAKGTSGCSGADLKNILNESALLAVRKGFSLVNTEILREAKDKVMFGKERRSKELSAEDKKHTAYHEAGHAIAGLAVDKHDPLEKVTIIPRGFSLGATYYLPDSDKVSYWRSEAYERLVVLLAGRAAEDIFFNDLSSGAKMDIEMATNLCKQMVCSWGMSDKVGAIAYEGKSDINKYLTGGEGYRKDMSEETAQLIDSEIKKLITEADVKARKILTKHKKQVIEMAELLLEFETLDANDATKIMAGTFDKAEKEKAIGLGKKRTTPRKKAVKTSKAEKMPKK